MNGLVTYFEKLHPLSEELVDYLQSNTIQKEFPRKTLLLKQGKTCRDLHFIEKGLARGYYFRNDTDITSRIMRENDFAISARSFFHQQPSFENIELIEDSYLISLTYDHYAELLKKSTGFNHIVRAIIEHYYIVSDERAYATKMKTARDRYEQLLQSDPQIFQRIPLKHIASYLGMKPETLSRIRSRIRY